jgi:hypothetical protein
MPCRSRFAPKADMRAPARHVRQVPPRPDSCAAAKQQYSRPAKLRRPTLSCRRPWAESAVAVGLPAEIPEWRLAELIPQHRCFRRLALSPVETRITRTGDEMVRTALYEAANVLLSRIMRFSKLKRWGMDVAKRRGSKRAKVALARKIGVILHRMWIDGTTYRWAEAKPIAAQG